MAMYVDRSRRNRWFGGVFYGAIRRGMAQPLLDLVEVAPVGMRWIVGPFVGPVAHYTVAAWGERFLNLVEVAVGTGLAPDRSWPCVRF
jgi:hypothetical protein